MVGVRDREIRSAVAVMQNFRTFEKLGSQGLRVSGGRYGKSCILVGIQNWLPPSILVQQKHIHQPHERAGNSPL